MKRTILTIVLFVFAGALLMATYGMNSDELSEKPVTYTPKSSVSVMEVSGAIGPPIADYITRSLKIAQKRGDEALIITLDTPGGLLSSTQDIVQTMLGTSFPIVVFVAPDGANAGSAGTFITMAAHIAAMAPATNIGAASPVSMGGAEMDTVSQKKIVNFSESFIESIAERRGRNAEWAKSAVRDGAAITAREALALNVIDVIAPNLDSLLVIIDGFEIEGSQIRTKNAEVNYIEKSFAETFLSFLIRPEVMLILTLVAVYGILGEVTSPGAIIPGVSGVIALILLLYGVAAMPLNTAGFILIGLAIVLFISEAFTPTYGILLIGGGVSFFLGAMMLFQDLPEGMGLSLFWLIPATILTVLIFAWIAYYGIRAQWGGNRAGLEGEIGQTAEVIEPVSNNGGKVFFSGEYWDAISEENLPKGERCTIIRFEGLKVHVRPITKNNEENYGSS